MSDMPFDLDERRDLVAQGISILAADDEKLPNGSPKLALIQLINHLAIYHDQLPRPVVQGFMIAAALLYKDLVEAKQIADGIIKEQKNG
jgi:hypothetical protein